MHQLRIKPQTSWKHIKILTIKPLQHFINKNENFKLYHVWHEIVYEFPILTYVFFFKFIQMLQMKR